MKLPRLYVNGKFTRLVNFLSLSINQNIIPLDTASITLPVDEVLPARSWVELFTPYGSAGMFRVRSPHDAYGQDTTSAELEHMISEVGDYLVKEEISEMLPANTAMQRVFKHYQGGKWKLGSVTALGSGKVAVEAKYDRVLDTMLSILEQKKDCMMSFDFSTTPWTVSIVKKGTSVAAEGRLARNMTSASISCDDTELCTRVWYQVFDKSHNATWKSKDASTKSKYGIVEGTVRTSSDMTDEEINTTVNAFLEDHKEPRVSVSIQAVELSKITGESLDKFTIGKLFQLALPDYGITTEKHITSLSWGFDGSGRLTSFTVNLGDEEDTVVTFLHNLDAKGKGGGGGGRAKDKEEEQWKKYISDWQKRDDYIGGWVARTDKNGEILEKAGLDINSNGVLVYAKGKNTIGSRFEITQKEINLKADRIELDAYVKAKDLTTDFFYSKVSALDRVTFNAMTSGRGGIKCYTVATTSLSVGGSHSFTDCIISASVENNTLTLTRASGGTVTFSKATTLTGAWSGGIYKVTASPQGNTQSCGMLQNGDITKSGDYINLKVNSGETYTGKTLTFKWKDYLTSHSNCVAGLTRYNSDRTVELFRKVSETQYTSVGTYYWYRKSSNSALTTYYD